MAILSTDDLDAAFDGLAVELNRLQQVRDAQCWPTDAAVRVALHEWLHNGRGILVTALVAASRTVAPDAAPSPGEAR